MPDPEDDPTRGFLDQTVPRVDDPWEGREPDDGPARPRHIQQPVAPEPRLSPQERRAKLIRNAAWNLGPSAAFLAGAALADADEAESRRPEREPVEEPEHAEPAHFEDSAGYGEAGSGW